MVLAREATEKYSELELLSIEDRTMHTVANKKALKKTLKFENGVEKKIEVSLETPEPEDFADAVKFFGGQDGAYAFMKKAIRENARKAAGLILNTISDESQIDSAILRAQREAKNYTHTGASKTEKANILDDIAALVDSGSFDENAIREMLARAK